MQQTHPAALVELCEIGTKTDNRRHGNNISMAFGALPSSSCLSCGCDEASCAPCKSQAECSNCSSCCCSTSHRTWRRKRAAMGIRLEYLGSAWMTVEAVASIGFGLIAGSLALLAFGGDSVIELISGFVVLAHLRKDVSGSELEGRRAEQLTSALLFALIPVIGLWR